MSGWVDRMSAERNAWMDKWIDGGGEKVNEGSCVET